MGQEGVRGAINIAKGVRKGNPRDIAKVAGATAGVVGLADLKKKASEEEENQRRTITQSQPKPRVLQTTQEPIKQAPSIVPKPIKQPTQPKNLVYKDTGIYQNGRLVG